MFKIVEYSDELNLDGFYREAKEKGFVNNSSKKAMIECFNNEKEKQAWILYEDDRPVGSVAAHSFDDVMGPNTYRVLTRVCSFGGLGPVKGLLTPHRLAAEHQSLTDQFLLPTCIEWVNGRGRMFATSNDSKVASQRLVHRYYFPTLEKLEIVKRIKDVHYRNTDQTVWEIFGDKFYENLNKFERWN